MSMKMVTIRQLQRSVTECLSTLPFIITRRGIPIAQVTGIGDTPIEKPKKPVVKKERNYDIDEVLEYLKSSFGLPALDGSVKVNRQYAYTLLRKSKTGAEGVKWLIDLAAHDPWFRDHVTSMRDIWNNQVKIAAMARKVARKYVDAKDV